MESNVGPAAAANCAECNGVFPIDNMIRHKTLFVCFNCKPAFMQKLAEGAYIDTGELRWAGFWIRFLASLVDGLILVPVGIGIQLLFGLTFMQIAGLEERSTATLVLIELVAGAVGVTYDALMIGRFGATLGKMACGLKVVRPDGGRVSYLRAVGRYFAKILNMFTLYIGFIMAAFDEQKRGLHDRICNTRVVYK